MDGRGILSYNSSRLQPTPAHSSPPVRASISCFFTMKCFNSFSVLCQKFYQWAMSNGLTLTFSCHSTVRSRLRTGRKICVNWRTFLQSQDIDMASRILRLSNNLRGFSKVSVCYWLIYFCSSQKSEKYVAEN